MISIVLAIALCQTIYEWTDADGVLHMTDDSSAIPAGANVKKTDRPPHVPSVKTTHKPTSVSRPNTCQAAKARVAAVERELVEAKEAIVKAESAEMASCQAKLNQLGQGAYAQCVGSRPSHEKLEQRVKDIEKRLEEANETLRKTQIRGCVD